MKKIFSIILILTISYSMEIPDMCKEYKGKEQLFCTGIVIKDKEVEILKKQNKLLKMQNEVMQELLFIQKRREAESLK